VPPSGPPLQVSRPDPKLMQRNMELVEEDLPSTAKAGFVNFQGQVFERADSLFRFVSLITSLPVLEVTSTKGRQAQL
jgi:hypothetical protein